MVLSVPSPNLTVGINDSSVVVLPEWEIVSLVVVLPLVVSLSEPRSEVESPGSSQVVAP